MQDIASMTAETILSADVLDEIFDQDDCPGRERLIQDLAERAKILGVKSRF